MSPAVFLVMLMGGVVFASCATAPATTTAPASSTARIEQDVPVAATTVWSGNYASDIQPIFDQYCVSCHGPSRAENGLRLDSYDNAMRGTQHGPVIIPKSAGTSTLVAVVQGNTAPTIRMPHEGRKLTKNRIQNIVLWIDAGASNK